MIIVPGKSNKMTGSFNMSKDGQKFKFDTVEDRIAKGNAPVLLEIICERVHCVMYDYAINTVDMVVAKFGNQVEIQTVVRRDGLKSAERYLELCRKAGKVLPVPTILINGDVLFKTVPLPGELNSVIESYLPGEKRNEK